MTTYVSCADYLTVIHTDDGRDAPATCRRLELERGDGYAVTAWRDGRFVADADGPVEPAPPDPFDLACERRWD